MQKIAIMLLSLTLFSSAFAMDRDRGENDQNHQQHILYSRSPEEAEKFDPDFSFEVIPVTALPIVRETDNKFGSIVTHGYIQPQFVDAVLQKPKLEVLEVGPGDGPVLQQILTDPRNQSNPIRYTMVEPCPSHLEKIQQMINTHNKNKENWFGKATNGDIRRFIVGKEKKYDLILCSQVLHFLDPVDQLEVLIGFRNALKDNGQLYIITNSLLSLHLWIPTKRQEELKYLLNELVTEIKKNYAGGDLWSGYCLNPAFVGQLLLYKNYNGINYDVPTVHSPSTLTPLLEAVGFKVDECKNFQERAKNNPDLPSIRLGAIATKKNEMNVPLITEYRKQAQAKRARRLELDRIMVDEKDYIMLIQLLLAQGKK